MSDKREFSWSVIFIWAGLFTFVLTAIFSATQGEVAQFLPSYIQNNFYRQFMWVAISAVALGVIQFISPRTFQEGAYLFYRSEEHTSELQSRGHLVCRLLLEKKKNT